ncbi:MAG TPA: M48 family metalloprotease [Vicinamibacterales bacterium]
MKSIFSSFFRVSAVAVALALTASPAFAQLGGLKRGLTKAKEAKDKVDDLHFSDAEERQLGEYVSALLIERFGVYQDQAVGKYVALLGSVLAQASSRPNLKWEFIVLDTEGVNAYAAPGGLIHITRGALGLMKTEAELAGVLGHEIAHVSQRHTAKAIQKGTFTGVGIDAAATRTPGGALTQEFVAAYGNRIYQDLFENKFDRDDEKDSDKVGIALANKVGYDPRGMTGFLNKVSERNKDMKEPNGVFASHPQTKDRISDMENQIKKDKLNATAVVAARYTSTITFDAKPASAIAMDIAGVRGAVGDSSAKPAAKEAQAEPKKAGPLGFISSKGSSSKESQTVASAGARGGVPDRDAVGGPNKNKLQIRITPADIEAFRKGIAG